MDSPGTLITGTLDSVYLDDFRDYRNDEDESARDHDLQDQEEFLKDDETLKEDLSESNQREGLSATLARKWSQLAKEYSNKFNLDVQEPELSHADMDGWVYFKVDQRGWKKRFAVLVHEILYIYKDEMVFRILLIKETIFSHQHNFI